MKIIVTALLGLTLATVAEARTWSSASGITRIHNILNACEAPLPQRFFYNSRMQNRFISGRFTAQSTSSCHGDSEQGLTIFGRFIHTQQETGIQCRGDMQVRVGGGAGAMIIWFYDVGQPQCNLAGGRIESPVLTPEF